VCPGCERGCSINIWHRKSEWKLNALDAGLNTSIDRVTPLENPLVNGPWTCNKARDLANILERPRATRPMVNGASADLAAAINAASALIEASSRAVALVSSWGSNEELVAFHNTLGGAFRSFVKADHLPMPGERIEDDVLIKADKNPNRYAALSMFAALPDEASSAIPADTDLVLVWGEGAPWSAVPANARVILLTSYDQPENSRADVLIPISVQTERNGHYTNFEGTITAFAQCFPKHAQITDAASLFEVLYPSTTHAAGAK
ncbi:MAG: NADH-quinone oxidoreductase, partial [Phycisphaerae bacterium]|nr:NADH-quinone oxidoreductase [Gemmatimonadaceae bacterium]